MLREVITNCYFPATKVVYSVNKTEHLNTNLVVQIIWRVTEQNRPLGQ